MPSGMLSHPASLALLAAHTAAGTHCRKHTLAQAHTAAGSSRYVGGGGNLPCHR